jgi:sugar O-acyltransferase (sialic acid O-acetyltransferase NeuD family)
MVDGATSTRMEIWEAECWVIGFVNTDREVHGFMKEIVIVGAGGFGREVAWLVEEINAVSPEWRLVGFLDDAASGSTVEGYPILGPIDTVAGLGPDIHLTCAIGDSRLRRRLVGRLEESGRRFATLIHPSVLRSKYVAIGEGSTICAGTILTTNINIGKQCLLNLNCKVGHDSTLGDFTSCMLAVNIAGDVTIEQGCYFGLNACVINQKRVGEWSIIGAGAAVVKDIPARSLAVGVPAIPIRTLDA